MIFSLNERNSKKNLNFVYKITALPVIAGGCSSHMNKKAEIKCAEDDTECQIEKAEKFDLRDSLKS